MYDDFSSNSSSSNPKGPPQEPSIPWWQRKELLVQPVPNSKSDKNQANDLPQPQPPSDRISLIEEASKSLEEDHDIKDAPMKMKITFLESKGLNRKEIAGLLSLDPDTYASSESFQTKAADASQPNDQYSTLKQSTPTSGEQSSNSALTQEKPPSSALKRDATEQPLQLTSKVSHNTPIITYPENLLSSRRPPPLITAQRVLTSLYAFSGFAAIAYGASKLYINPMIESLNLARHSLLETALTNIKTMNEKLEKTVSIIPGAMDCPNEHRHQRLDDLSSDIDPAELFHRSTATQTSPSLTMSDSSSDQTFGGESHLSSQQSCLQTLKIELADLLNANNKDASAAKELKKRVDDFHHYLDTLQYGMLMASDDQSGGPGDAVSKVKAEIRGMKGVLLSARSFPSDASAKAWG